MEKRLSPWAWVSTLYFLEGIPYVIVNNISVVMFTKMGVPNGEMALFTSLLYLPWMIKPFWSPFVDIFKTKRWWTVTMQILMSALFVLLVATIPFPSAEVIASGQTPINLFYITLLIFIVTEVILPALTLVGLLLTVYLLYPERVKCLIAVTLMSLTFLGTSKEII